MRSGEREATTGEADQRARTALGLDRDAADQAVPAVAPERSLGPAHLLRLQRLAGNAGVVQLLTGSTRPQAAHRQTVQRQLTEDQQKEWTDKGGPPLITSLRQAAERWRSFRAQPTSYGDLPDAGSAPSELAELLRLADPSYRRYAAEQLGGEAVKFLSEMAGFVPAIRLLVGVVPGVAYVPPGHSYVLRQKASAESTLNDIPFVPVAEYEIRYSNAYGWNWSRTLYGGQMQWKAGITAAREGGKWKPKAPKLAPTPARISVNTQATASSVGYWGYQDLAGIVKVVNGPSASLTVVEGVSHSQVSGGLISVEGGLEGSPPPGSLDFLNLKSDIEVKTGVSSSPPKKDSGKVKVSVTLNLVDAGGGLLAGGYQEVAIPELVPTPMPAERIWRYVLSGFETGSAELAIPPDEIHPIVQLIESDVGEQRRSHESIAHYLAEAGVQEAFVVDFYCEGYASRRWAAATDDAQRQEKNLQLSTERAANATAALRAAFGDQHTYGFAGRGAAYWSFGPERPIVDPQGGVFGHAPAPDDLGVVAAERSPEEIEALVRRREQELRDRGEPEDQIATMVDAFRESLQAMNPVTSDIPQVRRVNITISWRGHTISWGQNASPIPVKVP